MAETICDPKNCPTGQDLKAVHATIEANTAELQKVTGAIIAQTAEVKHITNALKEYKEDNRRDHDYFYQHGREVDEKIASRATHAELQAVEDKVEKKLELGQLAKGAGMVTAVAGFVFMLIKYAMQYGGQ